MSKIQINKEKGTIKLLEVRLSYPHLFTPWSKEEDGKKKYSGRFIMPNSTHEAENEALSEYLAKLKREWFPKGGVKSEGLFHRDGGNEDKPELEDAWYVAASESMRPQIIGRRREVITESDDIVYAGCYGNVLIKPWKQDNTFGKKINANLIAFQFVRDGERFGAERPDVNEEFEDVEDEAPAKRSRGNDGLD